MAKRIVFLGIVCFWCTMNYLLWRAEFRGQMPMGAEVPVGVVWEKVLTAPDDSTLEIFQNGEKMGYARWVPNVGGELETGKVSSEGYPLEGMVEELTGYTVELEGNIRLRELRERIRFEFHSSFSRQHEWRRMELRIGLSPLAWVVSADAAAESVRIAAEGGEDWARTFTFNELRDPAGLARLAGVPIPVTPLMLQPMGSASNQEKLSLGLEWKASNDWLEIGRSQARIYRLEARLIDRYRIVVLVSRVGEILRVELADGIVMVNDALVNY